ncbi:hypothetical protein JYU34_009544 [Plutella xylostella]|uniref:Uncharacterized protein n=1 Tax=Plutella xylostella TaxID=51655 RepID=A0ABQ7QJV9_PLUXY|nr:hypothetical protein JYU34_009544 [Plutella xylostella]
MVIALVVRNWFLASTAEEPSSNLKGILSSEWSDHCRFSFDVDVTSIMQSFKKTESLDFTMACLKNSVSSFLQYCLYDR